MYLVVYTREYDFTETGNANGLSERFEAVQVTIATSKLIKLCY